MRMNLFKRINGFYKILIFFLAIALTAIISCNDDDDNIFIIPSDPDDVVYEIHFIDVGQGDAILVSTPEKILLVDGGLRNSGVVEYLQSMEIEEIDIVIGTHPHADHIGGLIDVFYDFDVGEVIDPGVTHTTNTFNEYLTVIDFFDIPFTVGRKGMEWQLSENASMKLLHPTNPSDTHLNNASIVAKVTLGDVTLLLTGDAEWQSEQQMLENPELLPSNILKVGHHGSRTSSTKDFLEAVQPEISVIMCGSNNSYGHPHSETLEQLNAVDTDIYRTDIHGHIVIVSDGIEYTVTTEK